MTCVKIEPEAATVAPQATNSWLRMMIPQNDAANPAVAFRNEMSTGMSAPPIRTEKTMPNTIDNRISASEPSSKGTPVVVAATTPSTTMATALAARIVLCFAQIVGV